MPGEALEASLPFFQVAEAAEASGLRAERISPEEEAAAEVLAARLAFPAAPVSPERWVSEVEPDPSAVRPGPDLYCGPADCSREVRAERAPHSVSGLVRRWGCVAQVE